MQTRSPVSCVIAPLAAKCTICATRALPGRTEAGGQRTSVRFASAGTQRDSGLIFNEASEEVGMIVCATSLVEVEH